MCGLFFCENLDNQSLDLSLIRSHLMQRGRDEYNEREHDGNLFVHSRLSINTLDENGSQPYHGRKFIILFNGEIYNYHDLVQKHNLCIDRYQGYSECCVIEAIIDQYGIRKGVSLLHGMFAIIIYDKSNKSVTFFRDQFGIKPLFYKLSSQGIQISSIASLLKGTNGYLSKTSLHIFCIMAQSVQLSPFIKMSFACNRDIYTLTRIMVLLILTMMKVLIIIKMQKYAYPA